MGSPVVSERSALVVIAMSGGVDSSVTAALLAQKVIYGLLIIKKCRSDCEASGLRPLCSFYAQLGYPRRERHRPRV